MNALEDHSVSSTDSLVIEIVTLLEENGVNLDAYTLYDYIDPEALKQLVVSADASLEIQLTIQDVQLGITQHGVYLLK